MEDFRFESFAKGTHEFIWKVILIFLGGIMGIVGLIEFFLWLRGT